MGDENTVLGAAEVRHLLRRTGFIISDRQLQSFTGKTRGRAADSLVRGAGSHFKPRVRYNVDDTDLEREVHDRWLNYMISTTRQFQEKLVLFWHDHFACSNADVQNLTYMANQNQLLRRHCKGNVRNATFKDFVKAINRDAAMMDFLDTVRNTKNKPNENYARELQELFTLGVNDLQGNPNYSQADIVQIARAFTGWKTHAADGAGYKYGDAYLSASTHDAGTPKVIYTTVGGFGPGGQDITLGGSVAPEAEIDSVIDIIFAHRDSEGQSTVARFITKKLLEYLVGPNPPTTVIDEVIAASNFDGSSDPSTAWELSALLRAILVHDFFYATGSQPSSVKWPTHYAVSTIRQLKMRLDSTSFKKSITINGNDRIVSVRRYHLHNDTDNNTSMRDRLDDMGQLLLNPPSVFGWDWEVAWTNSGTLLARNAFAVAIAEARGTGSKAFRPERLIDLSLTDPGDIVDAVTSALQVGDQFPALSAERDALIAYLTDSGAAAPPFDLRDATFRNKKLHGLFCLVLQAPAYQLQ
jgi:uncharacterized protein (DUF1800 family)